MAAEQLWQKPQQSAEQFVRPLPEVKRETANIT